MGQGGGEGPVTWESLPDGITQGMRGHGPGPDSGMCSEFHYEFPTVEIGPLYFSLKEKETTKYHRNDLFFYFTVGCHSRS